MTMELGLVFRNTLSHISHFLSHIFILHFYLAFLSRIFISYFYLASRIFISHLAFFISYLAFLSRISHFLSRISHFLSRISHFFISYLASRIFLSRISHFYLAFNSRNSSPIKSHLECPLQASVETSCLAHLL